MLVNKIYLYDGKMTVLCNTQNGHFDIDLDEISLSIIIISSMLLGRLVRLQCGPSFYSFNFLFSLVLRFLHGVLRQQFDQFSREGIGHLSMGDG